MHASLCVQFFPAKRDLAYGSGTIVEDWYNTHVTRGASPRATYKYSYSTTVHELSRVERLHLDTKS